MPELDRFESQLTAAVHAFADRAETRVDAVAVAERTIGGRRHEAFTWLGRPLPVSASMALLAGLLLALFGWTVGSGGPFDRGLPAPAPTPTATSRPTPEPTPSLVPTPATTDGEGDEVVTGTETVSVVTYGSSKRVGDVMQMRGVVATTVETSNDPRATGIGTITGHNDSYGSVGPQWGTYRLENSMGAWEGTWTGALSDDGNRSQVNAWLVGSGAYEGYTYYLHAQGSNPLKVDGIIFRGSPPAP